MKTDIKRDYEIAHVFADSVPALCKMIVGLVRSAFPYPYVFLQESGVWGSEDCAILENDWVKDTGKLCYLPQGWWRGVKGYLRVLFSVLFPELSIKGIWRMIKGPKRIVFHGYSLNLWVVLLLRVAGKKMVLIHWGGRPRLGRFRGWLSRLEFRMHHHVFVLMSPEIRYFHGFLGDKVSVLPYASTEVGNWSFSHRMYKEACSQRRLLLGNSTWHRDEYGEILDRLNPNDWDCIICMLNYGRESEKGITDAFIRKYRKRFGGTFFAWQEVLPYEEYSQIVGSCPIYICPCRTQGGLGAIASGIMQGKTLFLRGDNLEWIQQLGVKAYDIDKVSDWSYKGLSSYIVSYDSALESFRNYKKVYEDDFSFDRWRGHILTALDG